MRRVFALVLVLVCLPRPVGAVHGMVIVVEANQIRIGSDTVPRFLDLPTKLVVAAGTEATLPADSTWDYLEVGGTLHCSRTRNTVVRFTHFFILPGGVFDCGSSTDPIPATNRVELIVRDVPINTARDTFQWGNGLLNFGKQTRVGAAKTAWTTLTGDVKAGATTITLEADPQGWQVGDELLLPDTRQTIYPAKPRREAKVTIAAIAGRVVTLSKPLDFEHLALRDPDNAVVLTPRVGNLTRNIVVRSENPQGTPGHLADVGQEAIWDVRYNELVGLGRTKALPLDSFVASTGHIGTNQVGRYNDHHHHAGGGWKSSTIGNVNRGSGVGKWGFVLHGTHDVTITDTIADGFAGSGFVTEDGYEVRSVFTHNLATYQIGNHTEDLNSEFTQTGSLNCPGCSGNGFWFRGVKNSLDSNEAWNNSIGINLFNQNQVAGMYPSVPGGEHDTQMSPPSGPFGAFPPFYDHNVASVNIFTGQEQWNLPTYPIKNLIAASNGVAGFFQGVSDISGPSLINPTFVCPGTVGFGIHNNTAYTTLFSIEGGRIVGCETGGHGGLGHFVHITGTLFQNRLDLEFLDTPDEFLLDSVTFKPLGTFPPQYVAMGDPVVWDGSFPLPETGTSWWFNQRGSRLKIKNWQGTGQDFRLFNKQQFAATLAMPATGFRFPDAFNCPEAGITMGQCWARYGMAYRGEAVAEADTVQLAGITNGYARPGLNGPLGIPKGIVTTPNPREPPHLEADGTISGWAIMTGDYTVASETLIVSIDGGPVIFVGKRDGDPPDLRFFPITATATGTHVIKTWRTEFRSDTPNKPIDASLTEWRYTIGDQPTPVDVCPNLDGMQTTVPPGMQIVNGQCVPIPPPPIDVCPNMPGAQPTVPPDRVLVNGQCLCKPGTNEINGQCVVIPPPPTEVWRQMTVFWRQLFINGVAQPRFQICTTATTCFEVQMKP
jgi:hypothetical protein